METAETQAGRSASAPLALDYLAAAIVGLAIFAVPISIGLITTSHISSRIVVVFVLECLLTPPALFQLVRARGGRSNLGETLGYLLAVGVTAWVAAAIGVYVTLVVIFNSSKCGSDSAGWAGLIGALAVYIPASAWSLRRNGAAAFFAMPAAVGIALAWGLLMWAAFPGIPGCYND
jgi:hypothetical protein